MSDNTHVSAAERLRELHELLWRRRGLGLSRWDPVTQQAVSLLPEIAAVIEAAETLDEIASRLAPTFPCQWEGDTKCSHTPCALYYAISDFSAALAALSARLGGE